MKNHFFSIKTKIFKTKNFQCSGINRPQKGWMVNRFRGRLRFLIVSLLSRGRLTVIIKTCLSYVIPLIDVVGLSTLIVGFLSPLNNILFGVLKNGLALKFLVLYLFCNRSVLSFCSK